MNSKFILVAISFIILSYSAAYSQETTYEGYIINHSGDTTRGIILNREKLPTPTHVLFTPQGSGVQSAYTAKDIRGFGYSEKDFVSAVVSIDKNPTHSSRKYDLYSDTVFLQALTKGSPALYLFRDELKLDHFYTAVNNNFELLLFRVYQETDKDGKTIEVRLTRYRDQLKTHFANCKGMDKKIERTPYNYNGLIKVFNHYYECSGAPIVQRGRKEGNEVRFGVLAGVTNTSIKFKSDNNLPISKSSTTTSNNLTGGVFLEFGLARTLKRLSLNNELLYSSYEIEGIHRSNQTAYYVETTSRVGASYLKLTTQFRYKFPIGSANGFINAGMSNGLAVSNTNYSRRDVKQDGITQSSSETTAVGTFRKYEQGYIVGAGARLLRYSLEARLEKSNGMSSFPSFGTHVTRLSLLFGVSL